MTEENKMQTLGMTQSDFGKALIDEARNQEKKRYLKNATEEIQRLLSGADTIRTCMERDKRNLEIYEARIKAIEEGNFTFATDYQFQGPQKKKIVYSEDRLNEAV